MKERTLRETVRDDRLRIVTKHLPSTRTALAIVANIGSAYDPPKGEGFFHFFEHMAFQGTIHRNAVVLQELLDRYCLDSGAETAKTRTVYHGESVYTCFPMLCDLFFEMFCNPTFPEDKIEKEKNVVLNEAAMALDDDNYVAWQTTLELLWQQNPIRRFDIGTPEGLSMINRESLRAAHQKWYTPYNSVVLAAGRIDHDKLVEIIEKNMPQIPPGFNPPFPRPYNDECDWQLSERQKIIRRPEREKAVIAFGCKVPRLITTTEQEELERDVLIEMLGQGFSSMLFQEVRDKRGLAYSIGSDSLDISALGSLFYFCAETFPPQVSEVQELMLDVICEFPLHQDHFRNVVGKMRDKYLVRLERPEQWISLMEEMFVDGDHSSSYLNNFIERRRALLQELRFEDIWTLRARYLRPERLVCTIVTNNLSVL